MNFLYLLEKIRMPGLNELMLAVTKLGEETAFLAIAMIVFWCVDKKKGYYVMAVCFVGNIINQIMKLTFRVPRPWVLDPNFTILEQAREAATGYSFPSGHTQSAVGMLGSIAAFTERKWLRSIWIILAAMVGLSRMYIGVHTPADVLVAAACAVALILLFKKPVLEGGIREMKMVIAATLAMSVVFVLYVELWPFPENMDPHNMESGFKNAYTFMGGLIGLPLVYLADVKWLNFPVKARWWVQILKVLGGLLLVLAVKEGLRAPLEMLLPVYPARAVRYFLIMITAGIIWPMSFQYFSKIGANNELRSN